MSEWKGEFLGFTYGGVHSSTLGIVRTSDGSRFSENLLPTQTNRTVTVPGRDETYFFGSTDTQKQFTIPFAFDSLDQDGLDRLRAHFANKEIRDLEFDERAWITWKGKVSASSIKYIAFDENGKTVYKGEGSVQITCYQPYGILKSTIESQNFPEDSADTAKTSGEISGQVVSDAAPADWRLYIAEIPDLIEINGLTLEVYRDDMIQFYKDNGATAITGMVIDSKTGLIQGLYGTSSDRVETWGVTKSIANQFVSGEILKFESNSNINIIISWPIVAKPVSRKAKLVCTEYCY